jgi:transketolase
MRDAFVSALCDLASEDDRVWLLTGDMGFRSLEPFAERFPDRFLNVGVAEQNLMGVATGLAAEGLVPFVYSIASFVTARCYEQFKVGPALHSLPVRVIGVGGGYDYGHAGPTHYALEDVSIMRAQVGVRVWVPLTPVQMRAAILRSAAVEGPLYLRLARKGVEEAPCVAEWVPYVVVEPGNETVLISWGSVSGEVLRASAKLQDRGLSSTIVLLQELGRALPLPKIDWRDRRVWLIEECPPGTGVLDQLALDLSDAVRVERLAPVGQGAGQVFASEADAWVKLKMDAQSMCCRIWSAL